MGDFEEDQISGKGEMIDENGNVNNFLIIN